MQVAVSSWYAPMKSTTWRIMPDASWRSRKARHVPDSHLLDPAPLRMVYRHVGQRLRQSEGREPVATPPVERTRPAVQEQTVVLLDTGVEQEVGQNIDTRSVAGERKAASEDRAHEEVVLGREVGPGRSWGLAGSPAECSVPRPPPGCPRSGGLR